MQQEPEKQDEKKDNSCENSRPIQFHRATAAIVVLVVLFIQAILWHKGGAAPHQLISTKQMPVTPPVTELVIPTQISYKKPLQELVPTMTSFRGEAMQMPYHVMIGGDLNDDDKQKVWEAIEQTFWSIHCTFNHFNPASEISEFNKQPALSPMKVSKELLDLIYLAEKLHYISGGTYDPTIDHARTQWRKALEQGHLLSNEELDTLRTCVGWHHIELGKSGDICKLSYPLQVDLSSIAKGYGVDMLTNAIADLGYPSIFVDWGGEIRVFGHHPLNRAWKVGINNPVSRGGDFVAILQLNEGAVATSGHSEQYWVVANEDEQYEAYSHLINPRSLQPLKLAEREIISCTVCAPTCAVADGLATTGILFDRLDEAMAWAKDVQENWPNCNIYFFTRDGKLWSTGRNYPKQKQQYVINYK